MSKCQVMYQTLLCQPDIVQKAVNLRAWTTNILRGIWGNLCRVIWSAEHPLFGDFVPLY